jgi:CRISPR system Cascade subunit CasC
MNVEAAASFSHAISTHKVANEVEFFTALDDRQEEPGSAHMGSLEFNSATYYRYISLDLGQLTDTMGGNEFNKEQLKQAIAAFTKALFVAVPAARQTTQSGASPWEFAKVLVRKGQRLQVPFDEPVKAAGHGFLLPSVNALKGYLSKKEVLTGSLFGKLGDYEWGEDETFSVDHLITKLQSHVE